MSDIGLSSIVADRVASLYAAHMANEDTVLGPAPFLQIPTYVASALRGGSGEESNEELDEVVAEGYVVSAGLALARLDPDELEVLGAQIQDDRALGAKAWTWITDQLPALR